MNSIQVNKSFFSPPFFFFPSSFDSSSEHILRSTTQYLEAGCLAHQALKIKKKWIDVNLFKEI